MTVEIDSEPLEQFIEVFQRRLRSSIDRLKNVVTSMEELVRVLAMTSPEDVFPETGANKLSVLRATCSQGQVALNFLRSISDRGIGTDVTAEKAMYFLEEVASLVANCETHVDKHRLELETLIN